MTSRSVAPKHSPLAKIVSHDARIVTAAHEALESRATAMVPHAGRLIKVAVAPTIAAMGQPDLRKSAQRKACA